MINEKDRNALISYRLNQAKETIKLAEFLEKSNAFIKFTKSEVQQMIEDMKEFIIMIGKLINSDD